MIADGKHAATLFDVNLCVTNAGAPAVSFVWETSDGERLSYAMALTDSTGRPNHFGIQLTRRWVPDWNGRDLIWFDERRKELLGGRATITVRGGQIDWVTPGVDVGGRGATALPGSDGRVDVGGRGATAGSDGRAGSPLPAAAGQPCGEATSLQQQLNSVAKRRFHLNLVVDPAKLAAMPEHIEPNFEEAKSLFDAITEGTNKLDADKVWTLIAKKVGPMQIDFGDEQWQQMIDRIRKLKSWSGVVGD